MKPKILALALNFVFFAALFLLFRFGIPYAGLKLDYMALLVISAVGASVLSPKFGIGRTEEGEKLLVKWFGIKKVF